LGYKIRMRATFKSLPEDPTELRAVSELMAAEIKAQAYQIEKLKKELAGHRKARFGSKSEAMDQLAFDLQEDTEIAAASEAQKTAPETDADQEAPAKRTHNRAPLPDHLERQEEILLPGDSCSDCGGALKPLGEDVTEELEYVPGHFVVKRIVRPRMTCTWPTAISIDPKSCASDLPDRSGRADTGPVFSSNSTRGAKQKPSSDIEGKTNSPVRARPRHSDKWFARRPYRAATAFTVTPGFRLSATICALTSSGHRFWPLALISTPWSLRNSTVVAIAKLLPRSPSAMESQVRQKLGRWRPGNAYTEQNHKPLNSLK